MDRDHTAAPGETKDVKNPIKAPISFENDIAVLKLSTPIETTVKNETGDEVRETIHSLKINPVTMELFPVYMSGSSLKICSFLTGIPGKDLGELLPADASLLLAHSNKIIRPIAGIIDSNIKLDMTAITNNLTYDTLKLPEKMETDTGFTDEIRINRAKFKHYDMWESKARNLVFVVEKLTGISRFFLEKMKPETGSVLYRHVNNQVKLFLQTPGF
jgi:hypothetical protein